MADFSIVIPNYNGAKFLPSCLNSIIEAIKNAPSSKFEIILVDNGSTDKSLEIFNQITQNLSTQIVINPHNLGFAVAVNQGIKISFFPYVCLVNNDLIVSPNWFSLISQTISLSPRSAVVFCGTILNFNGTLFESQGMSFHYSGRCQNLKNGQVADSSIKKDKLVWGASGALVVYQKDILEAIGLFDPTFFAYIEDVDVAFRLHLLGYQTILNPNAISQHLGGGTSNKSGNFRQYYTYRNWHLLILKDYSLKQIFSHFPQIFIERLKNYSYLAKNTPFPKIIIDTFRIHFEILKTLPDIVQKRHQFQNLLKLANNK